jgi:membrane protease YdiL (CAAX protease family)
VNPLAKILVYAAAVVLLAALLSPPIYWALHDMHAVLAGMPFHRFFNRVAMVSALVLLWPTMRWMKVRSITELGLGRNPHAGRDVASGVALALLPLVVLAAFYFEFEVYRLRKEIPWGKFIAVAGTVAVVPVLEEILFRGVLLGLAVRSLGKWGGAIVVSAAFAVIHFVRQRGEVAEVHWWSGFALLGSAFPPPAAFVETAAGAVNLFVIGMILAIATLRTRSLWLAIGLHAGWILGQQSINIIGRFRVKPPDALLPWVGPNVVSGMVPTGIVPLLALLASGLLVWWYLARAFRAHREPAAAPTGGAS